MSVIEVKNLRKRSAKLELLVNLLKSTLREFIEFVELLDLVLLNLIDVPAVTK